MRIAFYAPLKTPDHPVVSGDREMARLLMRALRLAGHAVDLVSDLRAYLRDNDEGLLADLLAAAAAETQRLGRAFAASPPPDIWFTYHPYYKSPDLLGPFLCARLGIPYVTAESSWSARRGSGAWGEAQKRVAEAAGMAAVNVCFTRRDAAGLREGVPGARIGMLAPFIDTAAFRAADTGRDAARLICVAMMRPGDKLASYRMLAQALANLRGRPWSLSIVGDGPCRAEVEALFGPLGPDRIIVHGQMDKADIAALLASASIYVWPGCGEAFGLAYLEAQAAGLPVVAQATAGVPEVVRDGRTGILVPEGDVEAFAAAIARLLDDDAERQKLAINASAAVEAGHSLSAAAAGLAALLPQPAAVR